MSDEKVGVLSPWGPAKKESPQAQTERMIEEAPGGAPRREVTFDGRAFQINVAFFSFDRDPGRLTGYAHDALGRAIEATLKVDGALQGELTRQSIALDEAQMRASKVTVRLGPVTLYVKASSFDPKVAQLMAMDRIGLALSNARGLSARVRTTLDEFDVTLARKA